MITFGGFNKVRVYVFQFIYNQVIDLNRDVHKISSYTMYKKLQLQYIVDFDFFMEPLHNYSSFQN